MSYMNCLRRHRMECVCVACGLTALGVTIVSFEGEPCIRITAPSGAQYCQQLWHHPDDKPDGDHAPSSPGRALGWFGTASSSVVSVGPGFNA